MMMKKTNRPFLVSAFLLCVTIPWDCFASEKEDPAKVKKALLKVQNQMQKLEKSIYQSKSEEKALTQQLALLDKEIGERSENLRTSQHKMSQHVESLTHLQREEKQLQKTSLAQQQALAKLLEATFQHYRKEKFQLLFEQQEWSTLARINQYYQFFYNARAAQINELQNHLKRIQLLQEQIGQEQQEMQTLTQKLQSEQSELQDKKDKRKTVLANLAKQLSSDQEQLSQLQQQEQHLEQIFKALQKKLTTTPTYIEPAQDFAKMKHQLSFPIQESGAKLTPLPNQKKDNAKKSYIKAETGTPVTTIFPGRVVFAEWLRGLGLLIIVDHGNGYMSLYGNNQKLYKGLGDWVNQGEMIARVGQSGGHAEPGLYFEIRKDGDALDPNPWFKQG
ncbi:MAG: hypothetical protein BGO43_07040 [Gammaproteobacteria bacterium 39-13]|nr:peptidoglycan DD-metalloendopeptidase family protein [Gammaproteobacteria bacterium]OJV90591.1 MAG: hypothetical protein BGO43_07040 [Gammaproteobacteria bacterium 39-13]